MLAQKSSVDHRVDNIVDNISTDDKQSDNMTIG
nr:MAG: hypothetical protein [Apis mellifera filamentous virus]